MANWKRTLDISDIWDAGLEMDELGGKIARKLSRKFASLLDFDSGDYDNELGDIIDCFDNITGFNDVSPEEEFNDVMDRLYNWADQEVEPFGMWPRNKMCWVKTSF